MSYQQHYCKVNIANASITYAWVDCIPERVNLWWSEVRPSPSVVPSDHRNVVLFGSDFVHDVATDNTFHLNIQNRKNVTTLRYFKFTYSLIPGFKFL